MTLTRRQMLRVSAAAIAAPAIPSRVFAQSYPARAVRLIVGNAAGGGPDIVARIIGQWLSERLGQPFVIDNRPGAGGNVATEAVVNAPADGHMLLVTTLANAVNASLYPKLSYDFIRDVSPVASLSQDPLFMLVNPSFPVSTLPEFIAYAKANPSKVNLASPGNGTAPHIAGELLKMMTKISMAHVPYRSGANALADLISGEVQVYFGALPVSIGHIKAGKLKALAMTGATRSEVLPDVPAIGESLQGYEASTWFGIGAPRNTPNEIVTRLNAEINAGLADPRLKARFVEMGSAPFASSPSQFGRFVADETNKWAKVVRFAALRAE